MDEFVYLRAVFFQGQGRKAAERYVGYAIIVHVAVWAIRAVIEVLQIDAIVVADKNKPKAGDAR